CLLVSHRAILNLPSFPTRRSSDLRTSRYNRYVDAQGLGTRTDVGYLRTYRLKGCFSREKCEGVFFEQRYRPSWPTLQLNLLSRPDRKSTRLNSSHVAISYAVFCLK